MARALLARGLMFEWPSSARFALPLLVLAALLSCAPSPRNVACANDGQCVSAGGEFHYCLESRCVECVGSASCGDGNTCRDGACIRRCRDGRDCPDGEACVDETCSPR